MSENLSPNNSSIKSSQFTSINESHDWDKLLQWMEDNPDDLIMWIENQPEYQDLVEKAKRGESSLGAKSILETGPIKSVKDIFWIDSTKLYGRADVSKELIEDSATTATTMSVANLINVFSTVPLLQYAFGAMGFLGQGFAVIVGILILKISNSFGEAASANRPNNKGWSTAGFAGFLSVNLLLSLIAPPGIELLLGQKELAEVRAAELIKKGNLRDSTEKQKGKELQQKINQKNRQKDELLQSLKEEQRITDQKESKIAQDITNNRDKQEEAKYNTAVVRLEQDIKALQKRRNEVIQQFNNFKKKTNNNIAKINQEIIQLENNLRIETQDERTISNVEFMKKNYIQEYKTYFTDEGLIPKKQGGEATRIAIETTLHKLQKGNFTSLGFAMFFFSLSAITSLAATAKAFAHSQRNDVVNSWNPQVIQQREELFQAALRGITKKLI